ncbi:lysosomal acid glucosylceramidase-like [Vanessa cardui]|uniref:lysosomal acid glucosylceramidase-like n=1 Tax=Vanessa cardui TaxID=171605 RepID=UPI001F144725|nr:lysosomal acid glucosylceramidase-like [Vanessa cardui]
MKHFRKLKILLSLFVLTVHADLPCAPRQYEESVVCVCNTTYCDTVTREVPDGGNYIMYTSSKSGKRFSKSYGSTQAQSYINDNEHFDMVLDIQPETMYQTIEGFGGAVTDSAGFNWKSLPPAVQQHLINSYCSEDGLEYSMIRVPNGSTDFSTRPYAYNEYPVNDTKLTNFTLAPEDILYKVPMIQACMKVAKLDVEVVTATWAPPRWMSIKEESSGFKYLNEDYYQAYADYQCKFAELYNEQGIRVWGLSAANEPLLPFLYDVKEETQLWSTKKMSKFLKNNLGPTIRNCSVRDIRILAVDDQRFALPPLFESIAEDEEVLKYIDGIAVHYYFDERTPPAILARISKKYPDRFILSTEACAGFKPTDIPKVDLGSWERAKIYIKDILENLNYNLVAWIDWNMCLNKEGGPTWVKNFVDSPVIVDAPNEEFLKQPTFYAMGHFSKFIPRFSRRVRVSKVFPTEDLDVQDIQALEQSHYDTVAFLTPNDSIVVVIHNEAKETKSAKIRVGQQELFVKLDAESISTIEVAYLD